MTGMIPSEASAAANSSFAFVYLLGLPILGEYLDPIKGLAVLVCLIGVGCLAVAGDDSGQSMKLSPGIGVEGLCAVVQALYLVFYRKYALRMGALPPDISILIAGTEGLAHLLLFWPGFPFLDLAGIEAWEWPPPNELAMLSIGAAMAAAGNIALMASLSLLPGPLIASVAALVTTPVQFAVDLIFHPASARSVSAYKLAGGSLVLLSFSAVIWRDHQLHQGIGLVPIPADLEPAESRAGGTGAITPGRAKPEGQRN